MIGEIQHRLKNLLAIVQALARQTKVTDRSAEENTRTPSSEVPASPGIGPTSRQHRPPANYLADRCEYRPARRGENLPRGRRLKMRPFLAQGHPHAHLPATPRLRPRRRGAPRPAVRTRRPAGRARPCRLRCPGPRHPGPLGIRCAPSATAPPCSPGRGRCKASCPPATSEWRPHGGARPPGCRPGCSAARRSPGWCGPGSPG